MRMYIGVYGNDERMVSSNRKKMYHNWTYFSSLLARVLTSVKIPLYVLNVSKWRIK